MPGKAAEKYRNRRASRAKRKGKVPEKDSGKATIQQEGKGV
jgi:hypothetical protein